MGRLKAAPASKTRTSREPERKECVARRNRHVLLAVHRIRDGNASDGATQLQVPQPRAGQIKEEQPTGNGHQRHTSAS